METTTDNALLVAAATLYAGVMVVLDRNGRTRQELEQSKPLLMESCVATAEEILRIIRSRPR